MDASSTPADSYALSLDFAANLNLVPVVRTFVDRYFGPLLEDDDAVSRLSMATHELMENAIKYAPDCTSSLSVRYEPTTGHVTLTSTNRAPPESAREVAAVLAEVARADDPMAAYLELMAATAERAGGSGLGLARVWVEGQMPLTLSYDGRQLSITGVTATARRAA